jgi:hypothetical protein
VQADQHRQKRKKNPCQSVFIREPLFLSHHRGGQ